MKYPIGIQSFELIRTGGYVYVDKTDIIYNLVHGYNTVFLGRPRRFGKSLLMSTLHEYFLGHRHLFNGLAIDRMETEWTEHPVLHFDLNNGNYSTVEGLLNVLDDQLSDYESIYGSKPGAEEPQFRLRSLIKRAYEQTGVRPVVLIDEYDKPVLQSMGHPDLDEAIRNILKPFYGTLKSEGGALRFVMLTGVSKFGKLSVFSDLNNIEDISLNKDFASICGLTEGEILSIFSEEISTFANELNIPVDQMIEELRLKYDGYRFTSAETLVFNPFSLLSSLKNKKLKDYWFESGTPTFLVKLLQENDYNLSEIPGREIDDDSLYKVDNISAIPLLYQTGYLTIKGYDHRRYRCTLGYPNQEVETAFLDFLIPFYSNLKQDMSRNEIDLLTDEIRTGQVEAFMQRLQSIFYSIPYAHDCSMKVQEDHVRNLMYIIFRLLGIYIQVECPMSRGRSDAVIFTDSHIYIFELKVNSTPEAAIAQIHEKRYAVPYSSDDREIILIGVNYSTDDRAITGWVLQRDQDTL